MKKLFYLLSIVFILSACEDDDIVPKIDNDDIDRDTITYVGGLVIDSYVTDINTLKSMYNSDMVSYVPTNGSSKSDNNYILIENKDGQIDTLGTTDGAKITINNVYEIYTINDDFLLFEKNRYSEGINITYEILTHEYTTVYDSVHVDSTTNYVNIVDTTYVNDEMWLVYYDTIDVVVDTTYDTHNYDNVLYNLNDGTFYDLVDNIYPYNNIITNSFNDPFYRNSDKSKFYYLNQDTKVIEVDLSNGTPMTSIKYDINFYNNISCENMTIFNDNIIYKTNGTYMYITKNSKYNKLRGDSLFLEDGGYNTSLSFILNNDLYYIFGDAINQIYTYYKVIYDETNDSIFLNYIKSTPYSLNNVTDMNNKSNVYNFSDDNYSYYFFKGSNSIVTISKNNLIYTDTYLDIENPAGINVPIELQTKMAKFVNGFIIYTSSNIYSINTNSKSSIISTPIADGYRIKDMTTDIDGNVIFYGKNKNGENIKGVINSDNTITETLVEYDANGVLITNLN